MALATTTNSSKQPEDSSLPSPPLLPAPPPPLTAVPTTRRRLSVTRIILPSLFQRRQQQPPSPTPNDTRRESLERERRRGTSGDGSRGLPPPSSEVSDRVKIEHEFIAAMHYYSRSCDFRTILANWKRINTHSMWRLFFRTFPPAAAASVSYYSRRVNRIEGPDGDLIRAIFDSDPRLFTASVNALRTRDQLARIFNNFEPRVVKGLVCALAAQLAPGQSSRPDNNSNNSNNSKWCRSSRSSISTCCSSNSCGSSRTNSFYVNNAVNEWSRIISASRPILQTACKQPHFRFVEELSICVKKPIDFSSVLKPWELAEKCAVRENHCNPLVAGTLVGLLGMLAVTVASGTGNPAAAGGEFSNRNWHRHMQRRKMQATIAARGMVEILCERILDDCDNNNNNAAAGGLAADDDEEEDNNNNNTRGNMPPPSCNSEQVERRIAGSLGEWRRLWNSVDSAQQVESGAKAGSLAAYEPCLNLVQEDDDESAAASTDATFFEDALSINCEDEEEEAEESDRRSSLASAASAARPALPALPA